MGLKIKHVYPKDDEYIVIHRGGKRTRGDMSWLEMIFWGFLALVVYSMIFC